MEQRVNPIKDMRISWLHCNKCLRDAVDIPRTIYISKCSHIICLQCAQSQNDSPDKICVVCGKPSGLIELNKLPPNVAAMYFSEPYQFSSARMQNLRRMLTFQKKTMDHLENSQLNRLRKAQEENIALREKVTEMRKRTSTLESVRRQKIKHKMSEKRREVTGVPSTMHRGAPESCFNFSKSAFNTNQNQIRHSTHTRQHMEEKQSTQKLITHDHLLTKERKPTKIRSERFF